MPKVIPQALRTEGGPPMDGLVRLGEDGGAVLAHRAGWGGGRAGLEVALVIVTGGSERALGPLMRMLVGMGIGLAVITHLPGRVDLVPRWAGRSSARSWTPCGARWIALGDRGRPSWWPCRPARPAGAVVARTGPAWSGWRLPCWPWPPCCSSPASRSPGSPPGLADDADGRGAAASPARRRSPIPAGRAGWYGEPRNARNRGTCRRRRSGR